MAQMTFWEAANVKQWLLSATVSDCVTFVVALMTFLVALVTLRLQRRQHKLDVENSFYQKFELRYDIYYGLVECMTAALSGKSAEIESADVARKYMFSIEYIFDDSVAKFVHDCATAMVELRISHQEFFFFCEKCSSSGESEEGKSALGGAMAREYEELKDNFNTNSQKVRDYMARYNEVFSPFLKIPDESMRLRNGRRSED